MENKNSSAEVAERKEGYYWVNHEGDWYIGKWDMGKWFLSEWTHPVSDNWFIEIDEKQICRS